MYNYQERRSKIFLEENQSDFLETRDQVHRLFETCKYIDMDQAIAGLYGSNWDRMAYVDRLVELGEIIEVQGVRGSLRIFYKA
jgi:hypothetical protein